MVTGGGKISPFSQVSVTNYDEKSDSYVKIILDQAFLGMVVVAQDELIKERL
jgi:hypothetical protein